MLYRAKTMKEIRKEFTPEDIIAMQIPPHSFSEHIQNNFFYINEASWYFGERLECPKEFQPVVFIQNHSRMVAPVSHAHLGLIFWYSRKIFEVIDYTGDFDAL